MHSFLEVLWREFRLGVRLLAKDRGFTIVAGLTLALGIGATTAIFSVFDATVLAPLPYREPDRLVLIEQTNGEGQFRILAPDTLDVWREQSQTLDAVANALMGRVDFTLSGPGGAERILIEQVDFETFRVFGVDPILGRWFQPDEVLVQGNTAQTIVIGYELWQRLGADPGIIGQRLPGWNAGWGEIVIGVMPRGFYTHPSRVNTDAWYIISPNPGRTIGRLAGGVAIEEAQAELDILGRPEEPNDAGQGAVGASRVQLTPLHDVYRGNYAETLFMLLGAVGFVLLIASVNVANLQLNRGVTRQAEMATRIALGAGRWGLFRQLVIENTALALAGGVAGILSAYLGIRLFLIVAPTFYPPSIRDRYQPGGSPLHPDLVFGHRDPVRTGSRFASFDARRPRRTQTGWAWRSGRGASGLAARVGDHRGGPGDGVAGRRRFDDQQLCPVDQCRYRYGSQQCLDDGGQPVGYGSLPDPAWKQPLFRHAGSLEPVHGGARSDRGAPWRGIGRDDHQPPTRGRPHVAVAGDRGCGAGRRRPARPVP